MANYRPMPELSRQELKARVDADDDDERYYGDRNEHGQRHGKGIYYFKNGDYYSGNWRKGRMEGQGKYVHAADGKTDIGWFYYNRCLGDQMNFRLKRKVLTNLIPVHYSANAFPKGYADNDERYVGKYDREERRHGEGAYYSSDGSYYKGNWRKGRMEGKGILVYSNGQMSNGWFYRNEYVGTEPNARLRTKIRRGLIPGPDAAANWHEAAIGSDSEDETGLVNASERFERTCQPLADSVAFTSDH